MARASDLFVTPAPVWLVALVGCLLSGPAPAAAEGRVAVPVASVFAAPSWSSERVTQVLLGDQVRILGQKGPWLKVLVPDQYREPQGYPGWMQGKDVVPGAAGPGPRVVVRVPRAALRPRPDTGAQVKMWAYLGTRLELAEERGEWRAVKVPGQADPLWVQASQALPEEALRTGDPREILDTAAQLKGVPYLWGGMSGLGLDCSGYIYIVLRTHGWTLPRDADQQFLVGQPVARAELAPGDLVFFGKSASRISHVGIYLGQGRFLDASGRRGVAVSTLGDPSYSPYVGARRILGRQPGVLRPRD